jgi:hypothetical protein
MMQSLIFRSAILALCTGALLAQELQPAGISPEQAAAMARAQPGPAHAALAKLAGEWTTLTKFSPAPGAPEMESTGAATLTMTLDGRFLREDWTGEMMGAPTTSSKTIGFNNGSQKYEAVWTYTMSTGMLIGIGQSSDEGKTIAFQGTFDEGPQGGGVSTLYLTLKIASADEFSWELSDAAPGAERRGPVMVTEYKRKQ